MRTRDTLAPTGVGGPRMPEKIWTYYDAQGNRVAKRRAVFAGKEVVAVGGPVFDNIELDEIVYRDVYLVTKPEDRRQFSSRKEMLQWFSEIPW